MDEDIDALRGQVEGLERSLGVAIRVMMRDPEIAEDLLAGFLAFGRLARQENMHTETIDQLGRFAGWIERGLHPKSA